MKDNVNKPDVALFSELIKDELEDYMVYQMGLHKLDAHLAKDFSILQTKGPYLEFSLKSKRGKSISEILEYWKKQGHNVSNEYEQVMKNVLPNHSNGLLYAHQEKALNSILIDEENVILPLPTGSGKTETFIFPTLQFLFEQINMRKYGLGCIMIYPMKALENDQRERIKNMLYDYESLTDSMPPILGVYDGDTPSERQFDKFIGKEDYKMLQNYREKCPKCNDDNLRYEMGTSEHRLHCEFYQDFHGINRGCGYELKWIATSRERMRNKNLPAILITNPESLDYRLSSPNDNDVFKTNMDKVIIIIDEAHVYTSTSSLTMRLLLSRLIEKIRKVNGRPDLKVQFIVSSATLDDPKSFVKKIIPYENFEIIQHKEDDVSGKLEDNLWDLQGKIIDFDFQIALSIMQLDNPSKTLQKLHSYSEEESNEFINSLINLNLCKINNNKLIPTHENIIKALEYYSIDNFDDALSNFSNGYHQVYTSMSQVHFLYNLVRNAYHDKEKRYSLEELISLCGKNWSHIDIADVKSLILLLIKKGRDFGLWEDRWHLLVKSPVGIAGCYNKPSHPIHLGDIDIKQPLPRNCNECNLPVSEIWACSGCGEIYYLILECPQCHKYHPSKVKCCDTSDEDLIERLLCRDNVINLKDLIGINPELIHETKTKCPSCEDRILPIRRKTERLIEMGVSLLGWHIKEESKRKMLLFTDSRAATERIGRHFNNSEQLIWTERVIMDIMRNNPKYPIHKPWKFEDLKKQTFKRVYSPYNRLRFIMTKTEMDYFRNNITKSVFASLEKSVSNRSRLFRQGLLGYSVNEYQDEINILNIELIILRVLDLIRKNEVYQKGVKHDNLVKYFHGFSARGKQNSKANFIQEMQNLAGINNENLILTINFLIEKQWIKKVNLKDTIYYMFVKPMIDEEDPYNVINDWRKVVVPEYVWICNKCTYVSWYHLKYCEKCDAELERRDHSKHVIVNYFAEVLTREPIEIVSAIHRAGLSGIERKKIEDLFKKKKDGVHLLSTTPTLELGIDIGSLSIALLAKTPPTRNSYIQRVGRAGRRSGEGAICITFVYPNPIDSYYFNNHDALISMKIGKLPTQKGSIESVKAILWNIICDASAIFLNDKSKVWISEGSKARDLIKGHLIPIELLRKDIRLKWDTHIKQYVENVVQRSIIIGWDNISLEDIEKEISNIEQVIRNQELFEESVLKTNQFFHHEKEVRKLKSNLVDIKKNLLDKPKLSKEEEIELSQIESKEYGIQKYEEKNMNNSTIIKYLHDVGTLMSMRGIGSSISVYEMDKNIRLLDEREVKIAISERFPGSVFSRQATLYQIQHLIYDPINSPTIKVCSKCNNWLDEFEIECSNHPNEKILEEVLMTPLIGFANSIRKGDIETIGITQNLIKTPKTELPSKEIKIHNLKIKISNSINIQIARMCKEYHVIKDRKRVESPTNITRCSNCYQYFSSEISCCQNPIMELVTQGNIINTYGMHFSIADLSIEQLAQNPVVISLLNQYENIKLNEIISQSLGNGLLNSISTVLQIEPNLLDVTVIHPNEIWIFEPIDGGNGLLQEMISKPENITKIFNNLKHIIKTSENHKCEKYCDQCLIVPRKSYNELSYLNRKILEISLQN